MMHPRLERQLEQTQHRLDALRSEAEAIADPQVPDALEEVSRSLEELRVAEEELQSQNQQLHQLVIAERRRYQELFEFGPDAYLVTSALGHILEANRAAGQLLGAKPTLLMEKLLIHFIAEESRDAFCRLLAELCAGQTMKKELPIQPREGPAFAGEVWIRAARNYRGFFLLRWMIRDLRSNHQKQQNCAVDGRTPLPKERSSAIGEMLAGVADSTRDVLERTRIGLEKLAPRIQDQSQKQLLAEIREAQEELRRLYEGMRDFITPALLDQR